MKIKRLYCGWHIFVDKEELQNTLLYPLSVHSNQTLPDEYIFLQNKKKKKMLIFVFSNPPSDAVTDETVLFQWKFRTRILLCAFQKSFSCPPVFRFFFIYFFATICGFLCFLEFFLSGGDFGGFHHVARYGKRVFVVNFS